MPNGNTSSCTSRYDGDEKSDVDAFIYAITTFKEYAQVKDALSDIPMLFDSTAATWPKGVKDTVKTWHNAIKTLNGAFSQKLRPRLVYRELFSCEQRDDESSTMCEGSSRILKTPSRSDTQTKKPRQKCNFCKYFDPTEDNYHKKSF
ncbi:Arc2 [Carabus blaptoides fortunei]